MARGEFNWTVFVVDDDASVRKALARLLASAGYAVETFASAREFLDRGHHQDTPGCVVLDVSMPGLSGLDLQKELLAFTPPLPIIFITGHGDIPTSVRAMKGGAVDFLTKPVNDRDLLSVIKLAMARNVEARQRNTELRELQRRADTLTPREREVMTLVVRGRLNKQAAAELGTVEKTIKVHRARVIQKMGVESLAELVRTAEKLGMFSGETRPGKAPSVSAIALPPPPRL
jgi:FixJ family two-component response regulator